MQRFAGGLMPEAAAGVVSHAMGDLSFPLRLCCGADIPLAGCSSEWKTRD